MTHATRAAAPPAPSAAPPSTAAKPKPATRRRSAARTKAAPQPIEGNAKAAKAKLLAAKSMAAGKGKGAKPDAPKAPKPTKPPKLRIKLVRDGFTMPETDFALIGTLKARALGAAREAKKSELLRAGLHALAAMETPQLVAALAELQTVKTGRPKKNGN